MLGLVAGGNIEFVPLSDTQFIMLSDLSALDEASAEFQRQPDGSFVLPFLLEVLEVRISPTALTSARPGSRGLA